MDSKPKLVRGPAFHLEGDGRWDVQELPEHVLRGAEYSGEIKIEGYPAVVFETPDGDQWAQKSPGVPAPKGDEASMGTVGSRFLLSSVRIVLAGILEEVEKSCPSGLPGSVGPAIGKGLQGEVYEFPSDDGVIKVGIAEDRDEAQSVVDRLLSLKDRNDGVLADIKDAGILCDIDTKESRWVRGSGTAYYCVMEKLEPLPAEEAKIAIRTLVDLLESDDVKRYMFSRRRTLKRDGDDPEIADRAFSLFQKMTSSGISHRDLNKGNIAKSSDGSYKLIDVESARISPKAASSASISASFQEMGKRVLAKVELEKNQIRSVQGLLDELRTCRDALDKAVQHSRVLGGSDASFDWIRDSLESRKEELDGLASGIRESLEYLTRMDLDSP